MIELFELISLRDGQAPDPSFLRNRFFTIYLPTEVVVCEPKMVVPQEARIYRTHHYWYEGEVLNYEELSSRVDSFKGCAHYDEVLLVEVWDDHGDDGHTDYCRVGWRFIPNSYFEEEKTWMIPEVSWKSIPFSMRLTWFDHSYLEDRENEKRMYGNYLKMRLDNS